MEWLVYFTQNPSQLEVIDWHLSVLCSLFYSANRGEGSRSVPPEEWSLLMRVRPKTQEELDREESERVKRLFGVM